MKKHIKEAFKPTELCHGFGNIQFPTEPIELKIPKKKRIYNSYGECSSCGLVYRKTEEYTPKYCCQCGKPLKCYRKLAAIYEINEINDFFKMGSWRFLHVDLHTNNIWKK